MHEQEILERIVDEAKPPPPTGPGFEGLHYLLFTPFRHQSLPHGSRFGSPTERSLWYGAQKVDTALAEKAYYQLLFAQGTRADLKNLSCDWSAFAAKIATEYAVDLRARSFADFQSEISSRSSYAASQKLGKDMRAAGVIAFLFTSARCPQRGTVIGLFEPAFADPNPGDLQTWRCVVTTEGCEVVHLNGSLAPLVFRQSEFEVAGVFPTPGITS